MTSLSGEFHTDLALPDALTACAEAIHGLGWPIESVERDRVISHSGPPDENPPTIEVVLAESDDGTEIRINGTDSEPNRLEQEALVAHLAQARDAIEVSIETSGEDPERTASASANNSDETVPNEVEPFSGETEESGEGPDPEAHRAVPGWYPDSYDSTRLQYWDGERWTRDYRPVEAADSSTTGASPKEPDAAADIEVNPVGIGLALVGAALMVIGVFLPHVESQRFLRVADNTLIQSGDGWIFIGLAVFIALAVYAAVRRRRKTAAVLVLAAIGIAAAVYEGTGDRVRLSSLNPGAASVLGVQATEKASPGTGVYAVGAGSGLAALGGLLLAGIAFGEARGLPTRNTKQCPDCAETVLADARVCKHCGFRFQSS